MGARPSGPGCSPARREAAASRSGMLRVCGQASLSSSITAFVSGWAVVTPVPWPPRNSSATPAVRSGLAVTGLVTEQRLAKHAALHEIEILIADDAVGCRHAIDLRHDGCGKPARLHIVIVRDRKSTR